MSAYVFHSSRPHESVLPRSHRDAHQRFLSYGPVQSLGRRPGLIARLLRWLSRL